LSTKDSIVLRSDQSTINPPDLSGNGNDGVGTGIVAATDIVLALPGSRGTEYNGTDEKTAFGDIGNIRAVSLWVKPVTTTEEIFLVDTGKDVMVNGGTVTYTGLTATATYVDGEASTTLVAGMLQHLVCVFNADVDANIFELATDGTNFGAVVIDELVVFSSVITNLQAIDIGSNQRAGRMGSWRLTSPKFLVGNWPLNGHAEDVSGHGNDGVWSGDEDYVENPFGIQAANFDGANDLINCGNDSSLDFTYNFSIAFWCIVDVTGNGDRFYDRGVGNVGGIVVRETTTKYVFETFQSGSAETLNSNSSIIVGKPTHIVCIRHGVDMFIYTDGEYDNVSLITDAPVSSPDDLTLGATTGAGGDYIGKLWGVRAYKIALTGDEVKKLYVDSQRTPKQRKVSQPIPRNADITDASLVGSWLSPATAGTAKDASANGNDLTQAGTCEFGEDGQLIGDGSSAYLRKAVANFQNTGYAGTLEFWYKREAYDAPQSGIFISTDEAGADDIFAVYLTSNRISLVAKSSGVGLDNWRSITPTLPAGQWYHVVISSDNSDYYFYLHGVPASVTAHSGSNDGAWIGRVANRDSIVVGADLSDSGTAAYLPDGDEIRGLNLYSENKSASWVSKKFSEGVPDSSLVLHVADGSEDLSRYKNALTNTDVIVGNGMEFNGTSSQIRIAPTVNIAGEFTLAVWLNPSSLTQKTIAMLNNNNFISFTSPTVMRVNLEASFTDITHGHTFLLNSWQQVVISKDALNNISIYKNGEQPSATGNSANNLIMAHLGRLTAGTGYFAGKMDDAKILNEAKSADYIKNYYLQTRGKY